MNMKPWTLITGIVVLALVCSSALAISKGDLMSYYRTEPVSPYNSYSDGSCDQKIADKSKEITPTPFPTPVSNAMPFPTWGDSSFLRPFSKPSIPSSPMKKPRTDLPSCPPAVPVGPLHCIMVSIDCSPNGDCIDPATGHSYPVGVDKLGSHYLVKPGCQCTWEDI